MERPLAGERVAAPAEVAREQSDDRPDRGGGGDAPEVLFDPHFDLPERLRQPIRATLERVERRLGGGAAERSAGSRLADRSEVAETGDERELTGAVLGFGELALEVAQAGFEADIGLPERLVLRQQARDFTIVAAAGDREGADRDGGDERRPERAGEEPERAAGQPHPPHLAVVAADQDEGATILPHTNRSSATP